MNRNLQQPARAPGLITPDAWQSLRVATSARIALGRAGGSLPTHQWLQFKAAHAAARDAVHNEFHAAELARELRDLGLESIVVESAAADRMTYLQRPDLGRRLSDASRKQLEAFDHGGAAPDVAIIVSDGLSALAAHRQAPPLLSALAPRLRERRISISPIVVARFGRIALQDEIGQLLGARLAVILIGERPGLGSPDSLGAYLVYGPKPGNADARRNCVSNIRPEGLPIEAAAETLHYLITESLRRGISGVGLKDERAVASMSNTAAHQPGGKALLSRQV